jgi:hypothetical protein
MLVSLRFAHERAVLAPRTAGLVLYSAEVAGSTREAFAFASLFDVLTDFVVGFANAEEVHSFSSKR